MWEVGTGQLARVLEGHDDSVVSVAFSPMGNLLASVSEDRVIRVWDVASGEAFWVERNASSGESVAFSSDGRWLAYTALLEHAPVIPVLVSVGELPENHFWWNQIRYFDAVGVQSVVSANREGQVIVCGPKSIDLLEPSTREITQITAAQGDDSFDSVACSCDGQLLATVKDSSEGQTITIWETDTMHEV